MTALHHRTAERELLALPRRRPEGRFYPVSGPMPKHRSSAVSTRSGPLPCRLTLFTEHPIRRRKQTLSPGIACAQGACRSMALIAYLTTIRFGCGVLCELPEDLAALSARRPLIVTDKG